MVMRSRLFFGAAATLPLAAAAYACNAGDPIVYVQPDAGTREAGPPDAIAVADAPGASDVVIPELTPGTLAPCGASKQEDGGCDPTAGEGCCFEGSPTGKCVQEWQVYVDASDVGAQCQGPGSLFLGCVADSFDSPCCWGKGPSGGLFTRSAVDCGKLAHSCDPAGVDGGPARCIDGTPCASAMCLGVEIGWCMGADPCQ
jgi:hypothetical protein